MGKDYIHARPLPMSSQPPYAEAVDNDLMRILPKFEVGTKSLIFNLAGKKSYITLRRLDIDDDASYSTFLVMDAENWLAEHLYCASCKRQIIPSLIEVGCENFDKVLEEPPHISISGFRTRYCPHCGARLQIDESKYIAPMRLGEEKAEAWE